MKEKKKNQIQSFSVVFRRKEKRTVIVCVCENSNSFIKNITHKRTQTYIHIYIYRQ